MSAVKVRIKADEGITLPDYATPGSSGMDLRASEAALIPAGERGCVGTGLYFELPQGYEAQVRPRSGLALKHGVTVLNSPGTIDSDYRGEVKVILINLGGDPFTIRSGDRIAQMVFKRLARVDFRPVASLADSCRGEGGFGSTGV